MRITFDPAKRAQTLKERGLDFQRAKDVFAGAHVTRRDYGEPRFIAAGWLERRIVIVVWTTRGSARRIMSMRRANDRESEKIAPQLE
jgi:uncharacterized DUF497 family protein